MTAIGPIGFPPLFPLTRRAETVCEVNFLIFPRTNPAFGLAPLVPGCTHRNPRGARSQFWASGGNWRSRRSGHSTATYPRDISSTRKPVYPYDSIVAIGVRVANVLRVANEG